MWFRRGHQRISADAATATADATPIFVESRQQSTTLRYWKWEVASLVLALCLLAAMVSVLGTYNGRVQSDWPHTININTLMALLGTALKACLVGTLAAIISQSKWIWFYEQQESAAATSQASHEKSSNELQRFDSASRGVFGSVKFMGMLPHGIRRAPLPFLAAITMILSIAIGPFIQQAIKTETCSMKQPVGERARLPVAFNLPGPDLWSRPGPGMFEPGVGLKGALVRGLTNPMSKDLQTEATCSTGNCTFPEIRMAAGNITHSTIAMCSKCLDFSDQVKNVSVPANNFTFATFNFTLDKVAVQATLGAVRLAAGPINLTSYEEHLTPEFREVTSATLSNISVLIMPPQPDAANGIDYSLKPVAAVCALYVCRQDIRAAVRQGRLEEQIVSTTPATRYGQPIPGISGGAGAGAAGSASGAGGTSGASGAWGASGAGGASGASGDSRDSGGITARLIVPGAGSNPFAEDLTIVKSPCAIGDTVYTASNFSLVPNVTTQRMFRDLTFEGKTVSVPSDCYYTMSPNYAVAIAQYFDSTLLNGKCSLITSFESILGCGNPFWLTSMYKQKNLTFVSLQQSLADVAAAATTFFRSDGWGPLNITEFYDERRGPRPSRREIAGQPQQLTVCIKLRWQWLLYTSILCAITIGLLLWSLVSTRMHRDRPVWKSSLLPLLYLDFRPADSEPKASAFMRGHKLHDLRQLSKTTGHKMDAAAAGAKAGEEVRYEAVGRGAKDEEERVTEVSVLSQSVSALSPSVSSIRSDPTAPSLRPQDVDNTPLYPTSMMPRIGRKPVAGR